MKVENRASRLITVGGINLIPAQVTEIPDKYANHPIIVAMLKNNELLMLLQTKRMLIKCRLMVPMKISPQKTFLR